MSKGSKNRICNRWKDINVSEKDHESCYRTGKKEHAFHHKNIAYEKRKRNALTWMNIEPSFYDCRIAPCTWRTFEKKYACKPRVGFHPTNNSFRFVKSTWPMVIRRKHIHRLVCARLYSIFMPSGCGVSFFHVYALVWRFLPKGKVFAWWLAPRLISLRLS